MSLLIGGYVTLDTKFYPRVASGESRETNGEPIPVLLYIATEQNNHWLGESSLESIAEQIANSTGPSGHNAEYLLRLANFMKDEIPDVNDDHLFTLESFVLELLAKSKVPLVSVMGSTNLQKIDRDVHVSSRRITTFEFASRIPERKARCLNI